MADKKEMEPRTPTTATTLYDKDDADKDIAIWTKIAWFLCVVLIAVGVAILLTGQGDALSGLAFGVIGILLFSTNRIAALRSTQRLEQIEDKLDQLVSAASTAPPP